MEEDYPSGFETVKQLKGICANRAEGRRTLNLKKQPPPALTGRRVEGATLTGPCASMHPPLVVIICLFLPEGAVLIPTPPPSFPPPELLQPEPAPFALVIGCNEPLPASPVSSPLMLFITSEKERRHRGGGDGWVGGQRATGKGVRCQCRDLREVLMAHPA